MAYATAGDLEARWRPLSPAETTIAETLLQDAAVRIDAACPPGDDPLIGDDLARRIIVSCEMVKRAMPGDPGMHGVTSYMDGSGPFQEQRNFANPQGNLYLTKADLRLLGCGGQVAGSVSLRGAQES